MTQGIPYGTTSYGIAPAARTARPPASSPVATGRPDRRLRWALRKLRELHLVQWLNRLPEALIDDAAPGPESSRAQLRSELNRLDARLSVRIY